MNVINQFGTDNQKSLLGTANTDWNDEVYRTAFGTDNNLSVSGSIDKWLPFRVSVGYYNQSGLVRKDNVERWTGNVVLTPSFFQDHLKLTINAKGTLNNNSFNNGGAVWAAATFNPTIPVYSGNDKYGGYNEALDADGYPVNAGVRNPRGLVDLYDSKSKVSRFIGSMDVDYKVHFLPDLKLHATVGADYAKGDGTVYPEAKVIVHLDKGNNLSQYTWMFDGLKQNGAKWDVIGMSLYPDWITDQTWEQVSDDCLSNIKTLSGKYNCDVIISEIGMVWNSENAAPFLKKMVDGCKAISTCEGVFYWEPECNSGWNGYDKGAFDNSGKPTAALDAFK
mgnify:CR=1 FL=1